MSEADKMFEKLGYIKDISVSYGLERFNKDNKYYVRFIIDEKCVEVNSIDENRVWILDVNMELLQAINLKCRELGWIGGVYV